ncbi:putative F-box/LRR-repeat protein At3g28410 [Phragmites australis]|uniref:putative F-box/LRR-repeat protein At3g28410 n=1 Tax=Phragmites australis TaxID=29695 RepID=UPI002D78A93A|nr:putative F-box/LRR-repeat protein At3g28410 [Phragmites australis]
MRGREVSSSTPAMGLLALQRERQRRQQQILACYGSIATVNKRKDSLFQRVGDDDSQHGEALRCSLPYLPEDIWRYIHSLMPMRDAARAACLSHAFLHSWRCHPNLTLDRKTLRYARGGNFICKIDRILRNHSGIGLKTLKLNLYDDDSTLPYVDSWLQVAVTPGIEELTLALDEKYNVPCSLLSDGVRNSIRCLQLYSCAFRPTVELGPLRSLTSLFLNSVLITVDELECLLSNSLALEQLDLFDCKEIIFLKIPCVLQQLSSLSITTWRGLQVIESKAPNLSRLDLNAGEIKLSLGELSQMKDFSLCRTNSVCYARAELPSIMPNLETLTLYSDDEMVNTPMLPTKFLCLKHLTISMTSGVVFPSSYDYVSLVSFFDASPSLETLFLDISQERMERESVFGCSSHLRQLPERRHDCLKRVEITGFSSAKSLVELTCCIVKSAVSLERLVLDTLPVHPRCSGENNKTCWPISNTVFEEALRTVVAVRTFIEDEVPPTAKLTVVEPCARCHSGG